MAEFDAGSFDGDNAEERLHQQAEELMRQGRFEDAVARYRDLRSTAPTSLWAILGHASALECAGDVHAAEQILDEARTTHRRNEHVQRFGRMFYERREDLRRAIDCREALRDETLSDDAAPPDQLADLFFNQGRYHEALNELQRVLNEEDCSDSTLKASVVARIGACLRQVDRNEEARDHLRQAIELEPENHWTLAELAEVERSLGNPDGARDYYHQALEQNPDDHWCRGHLAQLEHEQGNHTRAEELYNNILADEPRATWARVELAQVLATDDPSRAEALCQEALEEDPAYPWAWAQLGALARSDGRLDEARRRFQQALQASPTSTWILHELADTCRQLRRLEEAHAHLDHARSINPFDATTYGYTADILRGQDRNKEAIPYLSKAVELDHNYTWAWRELAELQALDGNHAAAEQSYREACTNEPDDPINDGLKAFLLRCNNQREAAVPFLERAVKAMPEYLWGWRELIELHLMAGRPQEAEKLARQALQHLPDQPNLLALLAEALRHTGRRDEAREAVAQALEHEQNIPQLWALAAELESDHDLERGRSYAAKAAEMGNGGEYQLLLAQLTAMNGDREQAATILDQLLETDDAPPLAYDLAADLAVHSDQPTRAQRIVAAGLTRHAGDARLAIRHATLALQAGETGATRQLDLLFSTEQEVAWREVAHLFARDGEAIHARRALARLMDDAGSNQQRLAEAWLTNAEIELQFSQRAAARQAAERALDHHGDLPGALVLAALLADGDDETARRHITRLDRILQDSDLPEDEQALLLRQVALLYERLGDQAQANTLWERSRQFDDSAAVRLEVARSFIRQDRADEALALLDDTQPDDDQQLADQLTAERAQAAFHTTGADAALERFERFQQHAGTTSRVVWSQLLCALGRFEHAAEQLGQVLNSDGNGPVRARSLWVRTLLGRWRSDDAVRYARRLVADHPTDIEASVVLAESLAMSGSNDAALATLESSSLGDHRHTHRAILGACLHLDLDNRGAAAAWLGRYLPDHPGPAPGLRLLAAALPGSVASDPGSPTADDATHLPPLARAAEHIASGLTRLHARSAAGVCLHAAAMAQQLGDAQAAKRLRAQAVHPLIRSRQWRLAWASARASCKLRALLRCCWPF